MSSLPQASSPVLTVKIHGADVPIDADPHLSPAVLEKAVASVPFQEWASTIDKELTVSSLKIQSVDMFGERVGFVKFVAAAAFHGKPVPGIVFMRGGAVAVLVVLRCEGKEWAVCTRQPRLPIGASAFLEIPAGMLDGSGHFSGVAAKEMKEETGIEITDDKLVDMTGIVYGSGAGTSGTRGMYPSVGGCDEFIRLLYYSADVEPSFLKELQGKATGCITEDEQITLDLIPLDELWMRTPDAKTLCALFLHDKLKASGKLS